MFRIISKLKNRKGFTLIELIVVLAVLAIIMAIAVPRYLGIQKEAQLSADQSTIEMLEKAAELYLAKDPDNKLTDLDTEAAKGPDDLAKELNTTVIEFKSDDYKGQEKTIKFSLNSSNSVVVTVTEN